MNLKNVKQITVKELKSQLDHVSGYLLIGLFLAIIYFLFLKTFFLVGIASLRGMFQIMPWIMMIFVPAITMGAFARERDKQTIEYLTTKPIKSLDLITGKILGSGLFVALAVLLTLPLPLFVSQVGNLDWGEALAGYIGIIFMVFALSAVGVMISSFFKSQIGAFLIAAATIGVLNIIGSQFTTINLPLDAGAYLAQLSLLERINSVSRGVFEIRDLVYFILLVVISYAVAYINLEKIRLPNVKSLTKKLAIAVIFTTIFGGVVIYSSKLAQGRLDLTANQKYTLSQVTKDVIRKEGKINIEVYASEQLPAQFSSVLEELKNLLKDYQNAGGSNITVQYKDPKTDAERLAQLGIEPIQFNIIGQDKYEIQQGYLAVVVSKEDAPDAVQQINFAGNVDDLEYQLTSNISKLKQTELPKIAFATGSGEKSPYSDYSTLFTYLQNDYAVVPVNIGAKPDPTDETADTETTVANNALMEDLSQYKLIIIADPTTPYTDETKSKLTDYLNNGGNILYLASPIKVDIDTISATPTDPVSGDLFKDYGVTVNQDLVFDTQSNLPVTLTTAQGNLMLPYPLFVRALQKEKLSESNPEYLSFPWPSSLNLADDTWKIMYQTTKSAGAQTGTFDINPQQQFQPTGTQYPIVAAKEIDGGGKLIVVGDSNIFTDQYTRGTQENLLFGLSLAEYMGQGGGLSQIKAKNLFAAQFSSVTETQKTQVKYIAPLISFILLSLVGLQRYITKKRLIKKYA